MRGKKTKATFLRHSLVYLLLLVTEVKLLLAYNTREI